MHIVVIIPYRVALADACSWLMHVVAQQAALKCVAHTPMRGTVRRKYGKRETEISG